MTDYDILGIPPTNDPAIIKKAYHKRVLQLHPDICDENKRIKNHYIFVQVCNAYKRLSNSKGVNRQNTVRETQRRTVQIDRTDNVVVHKDQAYVYYKQGISLFSKIHPSQWRTERNGLISTKIAGDDITQKEIQDKIIKLVSLFPQAYYYFSIVVNEYPDSVWVQDAMEKMKIIEERMNRYKNIIESFVAWDEFEENKKNDFEEMMRATQERYSDLKKKMEDQW